ncbi:MAG TPA: hypothetical protein VMU11_03395 [Verrucomicrobiae bacterium]|nr:hypothetical protein [Verrucomicrobiae bacterium]
MIRKNKIAHRPVYREIIPPAVKGAWRERWLWPLALLAGLVQTGGILDAFLISSRNAGLQSVTLFDASWNASLVAMWSRIAHAPDGWTAVSAVEGMIISITIIVIIVGLSLIAQGGLLFGIGGTVRGNRPGLRESLRAGAKFLPRVFALNIVTLGLMWLARFLMLLPLTLYSGQPSTGLALASVGMSIVYVVAVLSLTAIHFFALNSIVLQDGHVAESIERGIVLLRGSWLTVIEVSLILFAVGVLSFVGGVAAFLVIGLPVLLILLGAALANAALLAQFAWFVWATLFILIMLMAGAFNLSFQYRAWHHLYLRLGEGSALAKLHRWLHTVIDGLRA